MASRSAEDVCQQIFREPVVLPCSHSFCSDCLSSRGRDEQAQECPLCESSSSEFEPPVSEESLCEALLQEQDQTTSETLCSVHYEKLELFCVEHQQPVCLTCRDLEAHSNHVLKHISEAARDHKETLQRALEPLQEQLEDFEHFRKYCDRKAESIKDQAYHISRRIKQEFKSIHLFLEEEGELRISALRAEEEQHIEDIRKTTETISEEMAVLSDTIRATEEELEAEDASFLQNYKAAVKRVQQRPLMDHSELDLGGAIDMTEYVGNLKFHIWREMQKTAPYTPVILDPETAASSLSVSDDLTIVEYDERKKFPEDGEDVDHFPAVLGHDGFDSHIHSWDVEVEDSKNWEVGVIAESVKMTSSIESGCWAIRFSNDKFSTRSPEDPVTELEVQTKLQRITVYLDFDKEELSFFDADTHIHTFTHAFTERMFPYIATLDKLRILPSKVYMAQIIQQLN